MIVKVRIKPSHKRKAGTTGVMDRIEQLSKLTQGELTSAVVCAQLNKHFQVDFFSESDYQIIEQNGELIVFPKEQQKKND